MDNKQSVLIGDDEEKIEPVWRCLYTKKQILNILSAFGMNNTQPPKKDKIYISGNMGTSVISKSKEKSVYGEQLWLVKLFA